MRIYNLIPDIQHYIETTEDWYDTVRSHMDLAPKSMPSNKKHRGLRLSGLGDKCPRALWFSIHRSELAENLPASAIFKYGYGHVIEDMVLQLARLAGHDVQGEQDELVVDGIVGHRDAVIDGCVVDVKSCSSIAFIKYKDKSFCPANDDFGYLYQLDGYILGSYLDPLVTVKDKGFIFAVDKTLGHMALYEHRLREHTIRERISNYKQLVRETTPPTCTCKTKPYGESGNLTLDTKASYNLYKRCCFPELRTFLYKERGEIKPIHLVKVVRLPDVPELKYN